MRPGRPRQRKGQNAGERAGDDTTLTCAPSCSDRVDEKSGDRHAGTGTPTPVSTHSLAVGAAVLAAALYANTVGHDYTFDDLPAVKNNRDINWSTPFLTTLGHDFWGTDVTHHSSHKSYRPLTTQVFRLNAVLTGRRLSTSAMWCCTAGASSSPRALSSLQALRRPGPPSAGCLRHCGGRHTLCTPSLLPRSLAVQKSFVPSLRLLP